MSIVLISLGLSATAIQRLLLRLTRRRHVIIVVLNIFPACKTRSRHHPGDYKSQGLSATHTQSSGRERAQALPLMCQILPRKIPHSRCAKKETQAQASSAESWRREKSMIEFHIAQLCAAGKSFYAPNIYFVINLQTQNPNVIGWKDLKSVIKRSAWNNVGRRAT